MNAITPSAGQGQPVEPKLLPLLAAAVRSVVDPHPSERGALPALPPHIRMEASSALAIYDRLCASPSRDRVRHWLAAINAGVRNPVAGPSFDARVDAMMVLVGEMPVAVLTARTQREAIAKFEMWPSVAEVHRLLLEHARPLQNQQHALRRLANAPAGGTVRHMSDEERAAAVQHVRSVTSAFRAEHQHRQEAQQVVAAVSAGLAAKPKPLDPATLAALRDANPAVREARAMQARMQAAKEGQ